MPAEQGAGTHGATLRRPRRRTGQAGDLPGAWRWCQHLHHPIVGDLTLDYLVPAVEDDPEQTLTVYTTEPATRARRRRRCARAGGQRR
ncbi:MULTISPECIES: hypothetical protein [Streptomyces]|uniref:MmyB family transcriptional regulator n=1 Tax=Streptomyces TaxID=1883 RepID=UPI0029C9DD74|nr:MULTISPECIES: hypothetical protein [Streptomyces]